MDVVNIKAAVPDFVRMQELQDQIFNLEETWGMKALPRVREQLGELRTLLLAVERSFKESLIGAIVLLEDRNFVPSQAGADSHYRLATVLSRLSQHHSLLARQNQRLELFPLAALLDALPELENRVEMHRQQALVFEERLARLRQQQSDIIAAIEVLEKPSVASALKGLIPNDEDIEQIVGLITDPKIDSSVLKAATQKLRKHADVLEGVKTFSDLSNARSRLDARIEGALSDQRHVQQALNNTQDERDAVKALAGVEPLKNEWLHELRKLELQWQAQAATLGPTMALSDAAAALQGLCEYLKVVQMAYDRS
ncbi:alpha-xenorhabdolysin family binary toxin subunit B [Pseudomonas sp. Kh13]|uniref:alpha-xenorhabdolysin family binary toxin subunit B n=1 Tax=Pseudomonas sp. Kh13 TaxID=2093744 RepID=UPI00118386FE|nr:alpha-xenorhabdolysin family binary toxin subunit B [Pseudomonas sp. Kh13]